MTFRMNRSDARDAEKRAGMLPEGTYPAEVVNCEEKVSVKNRMAYFNLEFATIDDGSGARRICFDVIMLEGDGLGIGIKKLKGLGFDFDGDGDLKIEAKDLIGRRVRLTVVEEKYRTDKGEERTRLKPVFDRDRNFGYEPLDGAASASMSSEGAPCVCGHVAHKDDGSCTTCGCKAFEEVPF